MEFGILKMISEQKFLAWAESRFEDIKVNGDEIKVNSIFCEDYKHKLWCNAKGGKKDRPFGVYHCWKTDNKGTLVSLVVKVDKCSFDEAVDLLDGYDSSFMALEKQLDEMFDNKVAAENVSDIIQGVIGNLPFPEETYFIEELPQSNYYRGKAEAYLLGRKLSTKGMMVCVDGEYKNRIVIPYYDRSGHLIYYNGRYMDKTDAGYKYLGPPKEVGIGKGDVLFMKHWPSYGTKVFLTEGEFDSLSIWAVGLASAALGGKAMGENQAILLRSYIPIIALDNDKAGKQGLVTIGDFLLSQGFRGIQYVRPPSSVKDWNEMLVKYDTKVMLTYLISNLKSYDAGTRLHLEF